jgi:tRNA nucleotidyltransferase/poly(A) polymerase
MPKQLLKGDEIMKMLKIEPGKELGEIIKKLREKQLEGEIKTKKDAKVFLKSLS